MNLQGFTMNVSESEFHRVVRHEAGHTLGFEHEHMRSDLVKRIDRAKAIAFYDKDQGWTGCATWLWVNVRLLRRSRPSESSITLGKEPLCLNRLLPSKPNVVRS